MTCQTNFLAAGWQVGVTLGMHYRAGWLLPDWQNLESTDDGSTFIRKHYISEDMGKDIFFFKDQGQNNGSAQETISKVVKKYKFAQKKSGNTGKIATTIKSS